jgi:bifunctional ADP-heptose synthase (sugar kinase/adenylyltransferase)
MNTREKIVEASALRGRSVTLVTGYFDPLLAWHAERLSALRANADTLVALVLPLENALLPTVARAELAAALRVIDYVLILAGADANAVESLIRELKPAQFFRLDEEELSLRGELMAHVRSRQIR